MDAGEEDVVAAAEDLGGAIAVVDVPVEDEDPLGPELGNRQRRGDGDVVEEAEAHRPRGLGVMAGWPAGTEADLASPARTARVIAQAPPAERSAASQEAAPA